LQCTHPGQQSPAGHHTHATRRPGFATPGPEGLIEHDHNILEARTKLFKDYADNHFMTVYGEPTPQLIDLVKAHHLENQFKWFSFVKGLDSSNAQSAGVSP
jgi:hypothetical protein